MTTSPYGLYTRELVQSGCLTLTQVIKLSGITRQTIIRHIYVLRKLRGEKRMVGCRELWLFKPEDVKSYLAWLDEETASWGIGMGHFKKAPPPKGFFTVRDLMRITGLCQNRVREYLNTAGIKPDQLGKHREKLFKKASVEAFVQYYRDRPSLISGARRASRRDMARERRADIYASLKAPPGFKESDGKV